VSDEGGGEEVGLGPEIGGKETVSSLKSVEGSKDEVLGGSGSSGRGGVDIIDTGELDELLGDGGSDDTHTSGGGHESDSAGSALASDLHGHGMDETDLVTPISSSDGDEVELGSGEGSLDGDLDFLSELGAETDVTLLVTDGNDSPESGSLSGLGLLLDGADLHDLVGEFLLVLLHELVDDLGFLDGDGVGVDLLEGLDHVVLHESSELGKGGPFLVVTTSASGATGSTSATSTASSAASVSAEASASAGSLAFSGTLNGGSLGSLGGCLCFSFHLLFRTIK
jgi:hypothetical protein